MDEDFVVTTSLAPCGLSRTRAGVRMKINEIRAIRFAKHPAGIRGICIEVLYGREPAQGIQP
jgi:hypothetical protein